MESLVENEIDSKLKCLKSSNGSEYIDGSLEKYCAENGIWHETTISGKPRQNDVAKRMNQTILERARHMRVNVGLPKQFCADAVSSSTYLINKGPSIPPNGGIPKEAYAGKEVNLQYLKIFGCISYVHIDSDKKK